jgi:nucleotide-binding universal stress UspA family protein
MQPVCPIPKILVPIDQTDESIRVAEYTGCLSVPYAGALRGITLIHVIGSGYFTSHAGYVDLRVLRVEESEAFKRIRQMHYEKDIFPLFDRAMESITALGVPEDKLDRIIRHGSVGKEVVAYAREGGYSTIVLGRTTNEEGQEHSLGHIAQTIIQKATDVTVYVVGKRVLDERACPVPTILVPVDGSANARKALEHALCMAQAVEGVSRLTILCVRGAEAIDPERVFRDARKVVAKYHLPDGLVAFTSKEGVPGKEIAAEAELGDYSTVVLGRRGQSGLKHLTIGSIPLSVLHRTVSPTIALISP